MTAPSQSDSLVLAGELELWGGTVSANPLCPGAIFQVMPGFDLSAPQPTTDFVASLITDGERPFGLRASDRNLVLPVKITAPPGDWSVLAGARELLFRLIDQPFWTLTWTRRASPEDTAGFPLVLDCFRAKPSIVQYGGFDKAELRPVQQVTISFEALPYGRADVAQQIAFAAPVPAINAPPPPPAPVVLDAFVTINSAQCQQSSVSVIGPHSMFWDPGFFQPQAPDGTGAVLTYGTTFTSPADLTGLTGITFYLGLGSRYYFNTERGQHSVVVTFTLTDSSGHNLSFTSQARLPCSPDPANPVFTLISLAIPQNSAVFQYGSVAGYSLVIRNRAPRVLFGSGELRYAVAYLDAITAVPPSAIPITPTIRGAIYNIAGVQGTIRALAAMSFQQPPSPGSPTTITAAGAGTYTVPANTVYLKVEAIGGGGAGATAGWGPFTASGGATSGGTLPGYYWALTTSQAAQMATGDTFKITSGPNNGATVYTITAQEPPFAGFVNTHFSPNSPSTPSSSDILTMQTAVRGGGGGAEYARENLYPATPAQVIPYVIGAGGTAGAAPVNGAQTVFGAAGGQLVVANGGTSAKEGSVAGGAGGTGSGNTVHFPGGLGRTASGSVGGGGGSSGGTSSPGLTPTGTAAVVFTTPGSNNWTCPVGVTQVYAECWGGGGSGGTGGSFTNGCGGGGGEYAAGFINVTPGTVYHPNVAAGGAAVTGSGLLGNAGSNTSFTGDAGAAVAAQGGNPGQSFSSGGGGAGGSGSPAPVEFPGGAGGPASPYSGGGGSSAGTSMHGNAGNGYGTPGTAPTGGGNGGAGSGPNSTNGTAGSAPGGGGGGTFTGVTSGAGAAGQVRLTYPGGAPTNNGAAAVAGGGAGGAGGGSGNTAGTAGSAPGGGGGGGNSAGTVSEAGGAGAAGQLIITPYLPASFKTLVAHRPGIGCPVELNPLVALGGVVPGSAEFPVAALVTGRNARFSSTYTVVLIAQTWNSPGSARTVSVSIKQYESVGGASYTVTTTPVTFTPNTQISNGIVYAGSLTLPYKAMPKDNTSGYFTAIVTDSNGSDTFYDILFLDTQGQTVIINEPGSGYVTYYLDAPDPIYDLGLTLGSQSGRSAAVSVSDNMRASGGPLTLEPGRNTFLAYCVEGAPTVSVSYFPRYYIDRLW